VFRLSRPFFFSSFLCFEDTFLTPRSPEPPCPVCFQRLCRSLRILRFRDQPPTADWRRTSACQFLCLPSLSAGSIRPPSFTRPSTSASLLVKPPFGSLHGGELFSSPLPFGLPEPSNSPSFFDSVSFKLPQPWLTFHSVSKLLTFPPPVGFHGDCERSPPCLPMRLKIYRSGTQKAASSALRFIPPPQPPISQEFLMLFLSPSSPWVTIFRSTAFNSPVVAAVQKPVRYIPTFCFTLLRKLGAPFCAEVLDDHSSHVFNFNLPGPRFRNDCGIEDFFRGACVLISFPCSAQSFFVPPFQIGARPCVPLSGLDG